MRRYTITVDGTAKVVDVESVGANLFRVQVDGRLVDVELTDHRDLAHSAITPAITPRAAPAPTPPAAPPPPTPAKPTPAPAAPAASGTRGGGLDKLTAPMPGVILSIGTSVGATVQRGDALMVLEAMKMKNELKAPRAGRVAEIYVSAGQQVRYGEFLLRFE